ncbi:hypothetical protein LV716_04645 [Flagellimonas sp. HMM57]|uniref:hypothetical protein n=1 Tax=unclassified Flagellimonas TaxID=2644544 RepID=UPI0013D1A4BB|nr:MULTISPECIES: hypothetical protein [unclassified Flagellimonas]UII77083.1 hypothetical protein LV716_04645 [Flagellimonas sp. HMM57]
MLKAFLFALLNGMAAVAYNYYWYSYFDLPSLIVILATGFLVMFVSSFILWRLFDSIPNSSIYFTPILAGLPVGLSAPFFWQALTILGNRLCYLWFGECVPVYEDAPPPFTLKGVLGVLMFRFFPLVFSAIYAAIGTILIGILVNIMVKKRKTTDIGLTKDT